MGSPEKVLNSAELWIQDANFYSWFLFPRQHEHIQPPHTGYPWLKSWEPEKPWEVFSFWEECFTQAQNSSSTWWLRTHASTRKYVPWPEVYSPKYRGLRVWPNQLRRSKRYKDDSKLCLLELGQFTQTYSASLLINKTINLAGVTKDQRQWTSSTLYMAHGRRSEWGQFTIITWKHNKIYVKTAS